MLPERRHVSEHAHDGAAGAAALQIRQRHSARIPRRRQIEHLLNQHDQVAQYAAATADGVADPPLAARVGLQGRWPSMVQVTVPPCMEAILTAPPAPHRRRAAPRTGRAPATGRAPPGTTPPGPPASEVSRCL